MKPRTKLQREVFENSQCLVYPGATFEKWILNDVAEHLAYANKTSVFCLDCGSKLEKSKIRAAKIKCTCCNRKLTVVETRNTTHTESFYVCLAMIFDGYQVLRYFDVDLSYKRGQERSFRINEALQHWLKFDGESFKHTIVAKQRIWNYYNASWSGQLEIRTERYHRDRYDIQHYSCFPQSVFNDVFKKYGIGHDLKRISYLEAIKQIPFDSNLETLVKTKQFRLLSSGMDSSYNIRRYWNTIKMVIRNNYKIEDATMYFDYLDLLTYFRRDIRSPKHIFPVDLKAEHNRLVEIKRNRQRKEELERRINQMKFEEKRYQKTFNHFFDFSIQRKNIEIRVVRSVEECKQIGDELKHCVYTNEYYKKVNSIILTALVDGKHTETIEVNLESRKIVQCQGLNNENSEFHNQIMKLMKSKLNDLLEIHDLKSAELLAMAC